MNGVPPTCLIPNVLVEKPVVLVIVGILINNLLNDDDDCCLVIILQIETTVTFKTAVNQMPENYFD